MSTLKAPMPGVFYRRPSPEADPFVAEGDSVTQGETVALIEVMKSFNEVKAEEAGTVTKFLVEDGDEVSIGQDIIELDNSG